MPRVITRVGITFVVTLMAVGLAQAQSYGPPTYSVGDTWTVQERGTTRKITVVALEGDGYVIEGAFKECPTCRVYTDRNLTWLKMVDEKGDSAMGKYRAARLGPEWKIWDFPLEVNKTWHISARPYETGTGDWTVDSTVEAYEDVTVPAGTFKAYKVARKWTSKVRHGQANAWSNVTWFAPDVKGVVKYVTTGRFDDPFELVSYSLK